ncbi:MAG: hypothetical protein J7527_06405 [Chitinophagaceae bacterium]|nr:hypothetical protein [Chitinophagaceae bacterium]
MKKDFRWKIWFLIDGELSQLIPTFTASLAAKNLLYDYENEWEWVTGYSERFRTNINVSRLYKEHARPYTEPLVMLTDFSDPASDSLRTIEEIALAIAAEFRETVFYGWENIAEDSSSILQPVGKFRKEAINIGIAGRDEIMLEPRVISIDQQDKHTESWNKLAEYIDLAAKNKQEEFIPNEGLGQALFAEIKSLPTTIATLTNVTKVQLYGSNLTYIPPEIGQMKSMQYFDPYTSYSLHWFPYEITRCRSLIDSRISTRALYGNYKTRSPFPDLRKHRIVYPDSPLACSVCEKPITYDQSNQLWLSLKVGTDVLPLLVNACSGKCVQDLPAGAPGYLPWPHKGGRHLTQPLSDEEVFLLEIKMLQEAGFQSIRQTGNVAKAKDETKKPGSNQFIRLVRRIWEK